MAFLISDGRLKRENNHKTTRPGIAVTGGKFNSSFVVLGHIRADGCSVLFPAWHRTYLILLEVEDTTPFSHAMTDSVIASRSSRSH